MPSESTDYRKQPKQNNPCGGEAAAPPDQQQENLPCPRCDSTNTKFCYYNNYNFSQPRHFCKSCRRYWTRGGTLRDIPVGGGTRKSAKRSRTSPTAAASSSAVVSHLNHPLPATPILLPLRPNSLGPGGPFGDAKPNTGICGTFTSLLNNSSQGPGLWALGGFGLEEVGFELGRGGWAFPVVGESGGVCGNGDGLAVGNGWQVEAQDGGLGGGDCFSWPDLAISTPGNGFK